MVFMAPLFLLIMAFSVSAGAQSWKERDEQFSRAYEYFGQNNLDMAASELAETIGSQPYHRKSLELLSMIYSRKKEYSKALNITRLLVENFYEKEVLKLANVKETKAFFDNLSSRLNPRPRVLGYFYHLAMYHTFLLYQKVANPKIIKYGNHMSLAKKYYYICQRFQFNPERVRRGLNLLKRMVLNELGTEGKAKYLEYKSLQKGLSDGLPADFSKGLQSEEFMDDDFKADGIDDFPQDLGAGKPEWYPEGYESEYDQPFLENKAPLPLENADGYADISEDPELYGYEEEKKEFPIPPVKQKKETLEFKSKPRFYYGVDYFYWRESISLRNDARQPLSIVSSNHASCGGVGKRHYMGQLELNAYICGFIVFSEQFATNNDLPRSFIRGAMVGPSIMYPGRNWFSMGIDFPLIFRHRTERKFGIRSNLDEDYLTTVGVFLVTRFSLANFTFSFKFGKVKRFLDHSLIAQVTAFF